MLSPGVLAAIASGAPRFTPARLFASGEQGAWYDPSDISTLFQDSAGTTPVTALGQPVGLVLDKSRGGLNALGAELVTNGNFSQGATGWTVGDWTITGGAAIAAATSTSLRGCGVTTTQGVLYRVQFDVLSYTSGTLAITVGGNFTTNANLTGAAMSPGRKTVYVFAGNNASRGVEFYGGTVSCSIDNISVREVPGTHLVQSTDAARPTVQARVNLLERTEEFENAYWAKFRCNVSQNVETAPDGTLTADATVQTAGQTTLGLAGLRLFALPANAVITLSVFAKAKEKPLLACGSDAERATAGFNVYSYFNLSNGTVGTVAAGFTATIADAGNGWYRCTLTVTVRAAGGNVSFLFGGADTNGSLTVTDSGGIYFWGAQAELGSTATPYQRVTTATDYADIGLPRALQFDGIDDFLVSAANLDMSATDKVTMTAGVAKGSDAAFQTIAELSTNVNTNNGAFSLGCSGTTGDASLRTYSPSLRGTTVMSSGAGVFATPTTNVVTTLFDLGEAVAQNESRLRVDGVQRTLSYNAVDAGTGNFGTYPLYLGRLGGTTSPFTGRLHQLVIRGRLTVDGDLSQLERFVADRTGVVLP